MFIFKINLKKNILTRLYKAKDLFILKFTFCQLCVKSGIYCFLQLWTSSVTVTLMKHIFYRHGFIQQYNYMI